eukprot:CAMPEP_0196675510 /NCGR_PEP_ID=MMETSP1090-20130531/4123_1 /TAXON_ID=37098 /ORGANISM="Isochrysis sp, Strain CCMP1244" /LENGTH=172 /DNA_ID=CAMNT_0042013353 /DNA_START=148 /DNA_END=666 /DNA_ORIENTATION=-
MSSSGDLGATNPTIAAGLILPPLALLDSTRRRGSGQDTAEDEGKETALVSARVGDGDASAVPEVAHRLVAVLELLARPVLLQDVDDSAKEDRRLAAVREGNGHPVLAPHWLAAPPNRPDDRRFCDFSYAADSSFELTSGSASRASSASSSESESPAAPESPQPLSDVSAAHT